MAEHIRDTEEIFREADREHIKGLEITNAQLLEALEWRRDMIIEILQKSEPAGEGWFKVPPGVLARLGEIEELASPAIELANKSLPQ